MKLLKYTFLFLISFSLSAQIQDKVDFIHAKAEITPYPFKKEIQGNVTYTFNVLERVDSVFLDAKNMDFSSVLLNNKKVKFNNNQKTIIIYKKFNAGKEYKIELVYKSKPKQAVYFVGWDSLVNIENEKLIRKRIKKASEYHYPGQIWTQGQGKYTSHWLPSFDDMTEKVEFDLQFIFDMRYKVIANGKLADLGLPGLKEGHIKYFFDMKSPMSSYLLAFATGDFTFKEITSNSGVPIELYYKPEDSLKVEPTYRYSKEIFDFLEHEIGVPYPWQNYKQIPVQDFLYAGMENTSATIFSDRYVIDSIGFVDQNYINVNAHELAHQWFGDMVTEESGSHHWLQEGFATYYAMLAEKEIFGDDYYRWKLFESAQQLDKLSRDGKAKALTNPKASSLTFYEKGAWALHMLKEQIGENDFKKGVKNYLEKYKYKNVTIANFLAEIQAVSSVNIESFKKIWLLDSEFPYEEAINNLKQSNSSISNFLNLQHELTTSSDDNELIIKKYWNNSESSLLKQNIIKKYHSLLSNSYKKELLKSSDIKIRQAIAMAMDDIPKELKSDFETLLNDKSYATIENVLYKLWVFQPEDRFHYLNKTKGLIGLPNKNIRTLWLTFAGLTNGYENENKVAYLNELRSYTSEKYGFEVRQNAFQYINDVFGYSDENLKDLANACTHHSWQFKKFARNLLDKQFEDEQMKNRILNLLAELNEGEQRYIKSKLNIE